MSEIKIQYDEADLRDVIDYFVRGYSDGGKIEHYEAFVDTTKGKVIFKLYVRGSIEEKPQASKEGE